MGDDDEWGPTGKWGHLPADVREREREAQAIRRKFGWEVGSCVSVSLVEGRKEIADIAGTVRAPIDLVDSTHTS